MSIWYPSIRRHDLLAMIRLTALCGILAGAYGILHDQLSYSISPKYFELIKFRQFAYADFGLPPRVFVAEIGFLATWWVGIAGGWLLARVGKSELLQRTNKHYLARALAITAGVSVVFGILGALLGWLRSFSNLGDWAVWQETLSAAELRSLIVVTYLHWASYFGGFLGLVAAALYIRQKKSSNLFRTWDHVKPPN